MSPPTLHGMITYCAYVIGGIISKDMMGRSARIECGLVGHHERLVRCKRDTFGIFPIYGSVPTFSLFSRLSVSLHFFLRLCVLGWEVGSFGEMGGSLSPFQQRLVFASIVCHSLHALYSTVQYSKLSFWAESTLERMAAGVEPVDDLGWESHWRHRQLCGREAAYVARTVKNVFCPCYLDG
ncbi:hypothetical protein N657DRAFT_30144 [Parathielavia appendiculata]|uniref:Uncharacterized protein n=1 Tax=Parathielavia appendiculata TaxID=2587402 RepID=A0AAN6U8X1_9PEZI|nr:hypothetical protein N657DRAFT_30144 [Parathielavia appendiculata]